MNTNEQNIRQLQNRVDELEKKVEELNTIFDVTQNILRQSQIMNDEVDKIIMEEIFKEPEKETRIYDNIHDALDDMDKVNYPVTVIGNEGQSQKAIMPNLENDEDFNDALVTMFTTSNIETVSIEGVFKRGIL